jgi:predicted dehydrogenase
MRDKGDRTKVGQQKSRREGETEQGTFADIRQLVREPDKSIRVGVMGYGYWGSKHVRVLAGVSGVEVTVIDTQWERLREAVGTFPAVNAASRLDEVQDELDAVVIATPPRTHGALALQALRAGLHIMVEKPFATSVAEAEAIVKTADACGLTVMVGHTFEYNAAVRKLKEIITSGELGRVLYIDTARLSLGRYQNDCNVIWDLAPHDISIISYLLDESPEAVSVWAHRNVGDMHADIAYLRLNFPSAPAFIHVSWLDPSKVRRVTVVGDRKMAVYDDLSDNDRIRIYDVSVALADLNEGPAPPMPVTYRTGNITSPYVEFVEPLLVQDSHFVECIRTGCQPQTSGQRALAIVRTLEAADKAVATGAPAAIPRHSVDGIPTTVADEEVAS